MEHQELVQLRRILTEFFDEEDLKTLCFDLNLDFGNLPATNKAGRAREIVVAFQRSGRIQELSEACRVIRPNAFDQPNSAITVSFVANSLNPSMPPSPREPDDSSNPAIRRGSRLVTASGKQIRVESDFYGGATATLYRTTSDAYGMAIVKVFWRGLMPGSSAWNLFNQEIRAAEILQHKNIVRPFDRGLHMGYPFTVMEYLGGGTLRDWMRIHERMRGTDILSIVTQLAEAVDFAHQRDVIHRDIKPGNVLIESDPQGRVALADFGIAKILGAVERDITTAPGSDMAGSPGYLAPEVISGAEIGKPADIYSFGVVLYEMICGRIPFDETQNTYGLLYAKLQQDAPDIREFQPNVSKALAVRLTQTLSRDISARPKTTAGVLSGISSQIAKL